eukprot:gene30003-36238_t
MPSSSSPSGAAAASPASGIQSVWRRMVVLLRRWATSLIRKFMPKTPLVANAPIDASAASGTTVASAATDTTATTAAGTAEATSTDATRSEATGSRAISETATPSSKSAIWPYFVRDNKPTMWSSAPQEITPIPIGAFCSRNGFKSADLSVIRLEVATTSDLLRLKKEDILEKINLRSQAKTIDSMLRKAYEIYGMSYRWDLVRSFDKREKDKGKSGKRGTKEKDVEFLPVASRRAST